MGNAHVPDTELIMGKNAPFKTLKINRVSNNTKEEPMMQNPVIIDAIQRIEASVKKTRMAAIAVLICTVVNLIIALCVLSCKIAS